MDSNKTNQNIPIPAPPMAPTRPVLKKVKNKTTTKKQKEEHKEALQKYDQDLRLYEVAKRAYNLQLEGRNQESGTANNNTSKLAVNFHIDIESLLLAGQSKHIQDKYYKMKKEREKLAKSSESNEKGSGSKKKGSDSKKKRK